MSRSPSAIVRDYTGDVPVDLNAMADAMGLPVSYKSNFPPNVSGKIARSRMSPCGFVIEINANDPPNRQRFTLAHEIAHYVLHRDLINSLVDDALYRSNLSNVLERQANQYAAKLLLPAQAVVRARKNQADLRSLARLFQVSEKAMGIRLGELTL